jgi:integral membrane sensor domain MASE1
MGLVALAAIYYWAAKLGLSMATLAEQVTLVWPPTGIALVALLLFGYRAWPGIALGAFLANATTNEPPLVACGIAVGNTLEALLGTAFLLHLVGFRNPPERLRDVLGLVVLAAGVSTTVSATIGVTSLCLGGVQPWHAYGALWRAWWLGDAIGNLVVAPALLMWAMRYRTLCPPLRLAEGVVLLAGLAAVCVAIFSTSRVASTGYPFEYIVFPFVIWAALRFGQLGAVTVTSVTLGIAVWGTLGLGDKTLAWWGRHSCLP